MLTLTYDGKNLVNWTREALVAAGVPETVVKAAELDAARVARLAGINAEFSKAMAAAKAGTPDDEANLLATQMREAAEYAANPASPTPMLSAIAASRGIDLAKLVAEVQTKVAVYSGAAGELIGKRQRLEADLQAAETLEAIESLTW